MSYDIYHSEFDSQYTHPGNSLAHFGILGMKWGHWNEETRDRYTGSPNDSKRPGSFAKKKNALLSVGKETKAKVKKIRSTGEKVTDLEAQLIRQSYMYQRMSQKNKNKISDRKAAGKDITRLQKRAVNLDVAKKMADGALKNLMNKPLTERRVRSGASLVGGILFGYPGALIGATYGTHGLYPSRKELLLKARQKQAKTHSAGKRSPNRSDTSNKPYHSWSNSQRTAYDNRYLAKRKSLVNQYKSAKIDADRQRFRDQADDLERAYQEVVEQD